MCLIFTASQSSAKTIKFGPLENFPLYGIPSPPFTYLCVCMCIHAFTHNVHYVCVLVEDDQRDTKPFVHKEKPVSLLPVKTEVKEEAVSMTKAETTSAQPTTGMSSHSITAISLWS